MIWEDKFGLVFCFLIIKNWLCWACGNKKHSAWIKIDALNANYNDSKWFELNKFFIRT